jgi:cytochrome c5
MKKITFVLALFCSALAAQASTDNTAEDALKQRIAPVGKVYLAGAEPVVAKPTGPRTGEQVYQAACFACHGTGALDAPKKGDAAWKPRLAQGFDVLKKHAIEGIRSMPPRGTCADCSDDEIADAIHFMTEGV